MRSGLHGVVNPSDEATRTAFSTLVQGSVRKALATQNDKARTRDFKISHIMIFPTSNKTVHFRGLSCALLNAVMYTCKQYAVHSRTLQCTHISIDLCNQTTVGAHPFAHVDRKVAVLASKLKPLRADGIAPVF